MSSEINSKVFKIITPDDSIWRDFLIRANHDVYHLPEYAKMSSNEDGGLPRALYIKSNIGEALLPLLVRDIPDNLLSQGFDTNISLFDAISPYGYASPLVISDNDTFLEALPSLIKDAAAENNIVSIFIRLHPFLEFGLADSSVGVKGANVINFDLSKGEEVLYKEIKYVHTRSLKKLYKGGFSVRIIENPEDKVECLERFVELYHETMDRVSARKYYFFSLDYFKNYFKLLSGFAHLMEIVNSENKVVAALIFTACGEIVQYHLSGTYNEFLSGSPLKLGLWELAKWGVANNYKILNLGGGVGSSEDSLFKFKAAFATGRAQFSMARIICSSHYDTLAENANSLRDLSESDQNYFPIYRAGI